MPTRQRMWESLGERLEKVLGGLWAFTDEYSNPRLWRGGRPFAS